MPISLPPRAWAFIPVYMIIRYYSIKICCRR